MSDKVWYIAIGGQQQGPFSVQELTPRFQSKELTGDTHVFTQGMANWAEAGSRPEFQPVLDGPAAALPPPVPMASGAPTSAHEIDYEIFGEEMQFVEVTLDPQEACVSEAGAFMYMDPGIQMETIFGDGSGANAAGGFMGKLLGAGKRVLTGESLFMTVFGNGGSGKRRVAFAAPCAVPSGFLCVVSRRMPGCLLEDVRSSAGSTVCSCVIRDLAPGGVPGRSASTPRSR